MADNNEEIVVEVDVEPVDNVVPIVELLPQMARAMAAETERAVADPSVSTDVENRLRTAAQLAGQLAEQLQEVRRVKPDLPLLAMRPIRIDRPTGQVRPRPGRPGRPGRPDPDGPG